MMKARAGAVEAGAHWAIGTMSGTSLDGVDAAALRSDGETIFEFGPVAYRPYSASERGVLHAALGRWPGEEGVEEAAEVVETAHAELLAPMLADLPADHLAGTLVGFHGQTLAHDPMGRLGPRRTHQAGNGAVLAEVLGCPVVWDFRSMDVEMGGQGAPMVPFFHFACAKWAGITEPCAFLNLGGVGNVTWVDPGLAGPERPGAVLAFDTGPANAPLNDLMRHRLGVESDEGGALALSGRVDEALVARFLELPYFWRIPPKSLDRNEFHAVLGWVEALEDADAAATLAAFAAAAVARGFEHFPRPPALVLVSGGGRHNGALMAELEARLPCAVVPIEEIGLDGDMLEAQAFGYLALRVARGLPTSGPSTTGVAALVGGGRLSRP